MSNWGDVVRRLRKDRRLTQPELAERAGVKRSWLAAVETGKFEAIKEDRIKRLARALGLSVPELVAELFTSRESDPEEVASRIYSVESELQKLTAELQDLRKHTFKLAVKRFEGSNPSSSIVVFPDMGKSDAKIFKDVVAGA